MSGILIIAKGLQEFFPTIKEASDMTGISCKRLYRALSHDDGLIFNTTPPLFADTPSWEVTPDDIESYFEHKSSMEMARRIESLKKHDRYPEQTTKTGAHA